MQQWLVMACALSNLQTYLASMTQASYMISAMAEHGILPGFLRRASRDSTPVRALLLCGTMSLLFLFLPFYTNLALQSILYSMCIFVQALCILRIEAPTYLPRNKATRLLSCSGQIIAGSLVLSVQDSRFLAAVLGSCALLFLGTWILEAPLQVVAPAAELAAPAQKGEHILL
jgi:amino acid transporter